MVRSLTPESADFHAEKTLSAFLCENLCFLCG